MSTNNTQQTTTTNNQNNQNQQTSSVFDAETKKNIRATLENIREKVEKQSNNAGKNFIKFAADRERKRLSFTGKFEMKREPVKDFVTKALIPGKFSDVYYFECYDITDPNHPSQLCTWQRGTREANTILYWLAVDKNVLDVTRRGAPNSKTTTYDILPPLDGND